jgi:hypothetical protein
MERSGVRSIFKDLAGIPQSFIQRLLGEVQSVLIRDSQSLDWVLDKVGVEFLFSLALSGTP